MPTARRFVQAVLAVLAVTALYLLWPAALGGRTTYVATHGISMEPRFHTGDLAVLRAAGSYRPGDVIAYHSQLLGTTVMHRIVDRSGNRFVVRGDNNTWLDPDQPAATDVAGRLWLRIPRGGTALRFLRTPPGLVLEGAVVLTLLTRAGPARRRHRRRHRGAQPDASPPRASASWPAAALPVSVVAALVLTGTTAMLVHAPGSVPKTTSVRVAHEPRFGYDGTAVTGVTYPDGRIRSGQPVYLRLVRHLDVHLDDRLRSGRPVQGNTTARVTVTVGTDGGWTAPVARTADSTLGPAGLDVPVNLSKALRLLDRMRRETGSSPGTATLTVTARLTFAGRMSGHPLRVTAAPSYAFTLDPTALRPATGQARADEATTVSLPATAPRTVRVLGHRVTFRLLREAGTGAALLAWVMVALAAFGARRAGAPDEAARAAAVLATRLVAVTDLRLHGPVVAVASPRALLAVANRYDRVVLHLIDRDGSTFAVRDETTTYLLTVPPAEDRLRSVA